LSQYVEQTAGPIIDKQTGKVLGQHDGAIFYTIGQRHGLELGGGLPYYVVGKDMEKNEVYVTTDLNDEKLWNNSVWLSDIHWIGDAPQSNELKARVRHRAELVDVVLDGDTISFQHEQRAVSAGQSVVLYDGAVCLGGGIVAA
jgi:tRNA-specific 2-thiouridylase